MKTWMIHGLLWGLIMYILFVSAFLLLGVGKEATQEIILFNIPIWLIGGLCYGLYIRKHLKQKASNEKLD